MTVLLEIATATTKYVDFITKCESYYKLIWTKSSYEQNDENTKKSDIIRLKEWKKPV